VEHGREEMVGGYQSRPRFRPGDNVTFDLPNGHATQGNLYERLPATVLRHVADERGGHRYTVKLHDEHGTVLEDVREHRLSPTGPVRKF
jgi:hypothetical protein